MATKVRTISLLAAAVLGAAPLGGAAAHEYDGRTVATMAYDSAEDRFSGRVGSMVEACTKRRLVKVQELDGQNWDTVGKARSNKRGRWRLDMTDAKGTFRVVVRPRTNVTIEHDHRCNRYASGSLEVGR